MTVPINHLDHATERESEAVELIDQERADGNEMCQAMVNLPPFDVWFAEVRAFVLSGSKQQLTMERLDAVKRDDNYKELEKALTGSLITVQVLPAVLVAAEAFNNAWKDLPRNRVELVQHEMAACMQESYRSLALLVKPILARHISEWEVLSKEMLNLVVVIVDDVVALSVDCLRECMTAVGKLRVIRACLSRCYHILKAAYFSSHLAVHQDTQTDINKFESINSAIGMVEVVQDLRQFIISGKLQPDPERLEPASKKMHEYYKTLREMEQQKDVQIDGYSEVVKTMCPMLKKWGQSLSAEVLVPLQTKFFSEIFSHVHLQDHHRIHCCMFPC